MRPNLLTVKPFWLKIGGTAFYLVSAALILMGISRMIEPIYNQSQMGLAKYSCLGILNFYEVALLGIALLIVIWKQVMDDAVSLLVLVGVFIVGSSVAIDTIAPDNPAIAICAGGLLTLLAIAKIYAVQRYLTGNKSAWPIWGTGIVLVWNFFMPGILALQGSNSANEGLLHNIWWLGIYLLLVGGVFMFAQACSLRQSGLAEQDRDRPLLKSVSMIWIFVTIIFAATAAHVYSLSWVYGKYFDFKPGDMLPLAGVMALIVMELRRSYTQDFNVFDVNIALAPLGGAIWILLSREYSRELWQGMGFVSYPPVFLLIMAVVLVLFARRYRSSELLNVIFCYAITATFFMGVDSHIHTGEALNWNLSGYLFSAVMIFNAVWKHNPTYAFVGFGYLSVVLYQTFSDHVEWLLIILSFIALIIGACFSLLKGSRDDGDAEVQTVNDKPTDTPDDLLVPKSRKGQPVLLAVIILALFIGFGFVSAIRNNGWRISAHRVKLIANLKACGPAMELFKIKSKGRIPESLNSLANNQHLPAKLFLNPITGRRDYIYLKPDPTSTAIVPLIVAPCGDGAVILMSNNSCKYYRPGSHEYRMVAKHLPVREETK